MDQTAAPTSWSHRSARSANACLLWEAHAFCMSTTSSVCHRQSVPNGNPTATRPHLLEETYRLLLAVATNANRSCRLIAFQIVTWP